MRHEDTDEKKRHTFFKNSKQMGLIGKERTDLNLVVRESERKRR